MVTRDGWEGQFDVTEEDNGRVGTVGAVMLMGDVGEEGVDCVEGLSVLLAGALRRCKKAGQKGVMEEGVSEDTLLDHEKGVGESDSSEIVGI